MVNENNKCCFCFKPRTGSLIIGYLNLVFIIGSMINETVFLLTVESTKEFPEIDARNGMKLLNIIFGIVMFIYVLYLAFTITLVVGLHQHKPKLVLAFIKFQNSVICVSIIYFFRFLKYFELEDYCINLLFFIKNIYIATVLMSYHKMMELGSGVNHNVA